jgi:GT2 family glycosyltransferase
VWNGSSVLPGCLAAIEAHAGERLLETICVDNASQDGSADLVASRHGWVRLLRQPVNLGFAGGVNAGADAAQGSVVVLLNQDCMVQPGWLDALIEALEADPALGIAGATILGPDGGVDHAGAEIRHPDASGVHLTEIGGETPAEVDYVTGAAMAIRRSTWETVGRFDEGFYPAYYEDADYCYRARHHGVRVAQVPGARVVHLHSSDAWQADPVAHAARHHASRYRFVSKHFDCAEIDAFVQAETEALAAEAYLDQVLARAIAARKIASGLPDVIERRRSDLGDAMDDNESPVRHRQIALAMAHIRRMALSDAERLLDAGLPKPPVEAWQTSNRALREALDEPLPDGAPEPADAWPATRERLARLVPQEYELLSRIHFHPDEPEAEPRWRRAFRHRVLRPLSALLGREDALQSRLLALQIEHLDILASLTTALVEGEAGLGGIAPAYRRRLALIWQLMDAREKQEEWLQRYHRERLQRRLELLETLAEYE